MIKTRPPHGFTLVELMVTLAVIAIVVSIAAPSFGQLIRENRAATQANNVLASIQLARSEAINRGIEVTMLPASNSNWHEGWTVFTDWDADGVFDGDVDDKDCSIENQDCLLTVQNELPNSLELTTGGTLTNGITFIPSGQITQVGGGLGNDTFTLCAPLTNQREIIVGPGGRPRVVSLEVEC